MPHFTQKITKILITLAKYVAIFLVIYTAVNYYRKPIMPQDGDLHFSTLQGQVIDVATVSHDKPILLYFWGTWCGVCSKTSPIVSQLAHDRQGQVLSVAVQSGSHDELIGYLSDKGYRFGVVNDETGQIFHAWQGQVTPSYVIIKNGQIVQGFTGFAPLWSLKLRLAMA